LVGWRVEGGALSHTMKKLYTIFKNWKLSSKFLGETSSSYTSKKSKRSSLPKTQTLQKVNNVLINYVK